MSELGFIVDSLIYLQSSDFGFLKMREGVKSNSLLANIDSRNTGNTLDLRSLIVHCSIYSQLVILSFLDLQSVMAISEVNKEFHMLSQDLLLWKRMFVKRFHKGIIRSP